MTCPPLMRKGEPFTEYLVRVTAIRRPAVTDPGRRQKPKTREKTMIEVKTALGPLTTSPGQVRLLPFQRSVDSDNVRRWHRRFCAFGPSGIG